jgi:hypothetical protein
VHSVKRPSGLQSSPKPGSGELGRLGSCPINRAAFVRQLPDCSRSPEPSPIKRENTLLASRTPSRRAGIQLRRAQQQMAVRPQATSDKLRALPVRVPRPLKLTRMGSCLTAAGPSAGRDRVLVRSRRTVPEAQSFP